MQHVEIIHVNLKIDFLGVGWGVLGCVVKLSSIRTILT
jgi:hypothetical protein